MRTHDVFVSYASPDRSFAEACVHTLEHSGIRCWCAPRDIAAGASWASNIVGAIDEARVMILVMSHAASASKHVFREVERAVHKGVVVVPVRIEDVTPEGDLEFFLSSVHWLDALSPERENALRQLVECIGAIVETTPPGKEEEYDDHGSDDTCLPEGPGSPDPNQPNAALRKHLVWAAPTAIVLAILLLVAIVSLGGKQPTPEPAPTIVETAPAAAPIEVPDSTPGPKADNSAIILAQAEADRLAEQLKAAGQEVELGPEIAEAGSRLEIAQRLIESGESEAALESYQQFTDLANSILAKRDRLAVRDPAEPQPQPQPLTDEEVKSRLDEAIAKANNGEWLAAKQKLDPLIRARPDDPKVRALSRLADGLCLAEGLGTRKNTAGAVKALEESSSLGLANASWQLATWHDNGTHGVRVDKARALEHYATAAEQGDAKAALQAAQRYMQGIGTSVNMQAAKVYAKIAAENGSAQGAYLMGTLTSGSVMVQWLEKSTKGGYALAYGRLGFLYLYGNEGVQLDPQEAYRIFTAGSKVDDPTSWYGLGTISYYGMLGGRPDKANGEKYFRRAATLGSPEARRWLIDNP